MTLKTTLFRKGFDLALPFFWRKHKAEHISSEDKCIPVNGANITVRIYTPPGDALQPTIVYYHGGGFVIGSLNAYDGCCSDLADKTGYKVVSVDYRLAPEHRFPAAAEDAIAAFEWVHNNAASLNADAEKLYVCGDSAGGNLAAVVTLAMRDKGSDAVKGQVLIYPVTEHYSGGRESYISKGKGYALTSAQMRWFWDSYLSDSPALENGQTEHPLATPSSHSDHSNLPPAFVLTAENDPLHDEGVAYAEQLRAAGCQVQHTDYPGYAHGFIGVLGPKEEHQKGMGDIAAWFLANSRA